MCEAPIQYPPLRVRATQDREEECIKAKSIVKEVIKIPAKTINPVIGGLVEGMEKMNVKEEVRKNIKKVRDRGRMEETKGKDSKIDITYTVNKIRGGQEIKMNTGKNRTENRGEERKTVNRVTEVYKGQEERN